MIFPGAISSSTLQKVPTPECCLYDAITNTCELFHKPTLIPYFTLKLSQAQALQSPPAPKMQVHLCHAIKDKSEAIKYTVVHLNGSCSSSFQQGFGPSAVVV